MNNEVHPMTVSDTRLVKHWLHAQFHQTGSVTGLPHSGWPRVIQAFRYFETSSLRPWILPANTELMCSGRVSRSGSICCTRRVTLVRNSMISHEWGNDRIVCTTNKCLHPSCDDCSICDIMRGTLLVALFLHKSKMTTWYIPFVVITIRSFPHSWLIINYTRLLLHHRLATESDN
jgi:hypothetical protein